MKQPKTATKSPPGRAAGAGENFGAAGDGVFIGQCKGKEGFCQDAAPPLSAEASARLQLLAQRTGLAPAAIVEALVRGADPQLVRTVATLTPRLVGQGWRPRRLAPVEFLVAGGDHERVS